MDYQIVNLEEKTIVGISTTSSNSDPEMTQKIGKLWEDLYQGGMKEKIKNKVNKYAIGLYSDYNGDNYTVTAGNQVSKAENSEFTTKIIPAGKYAKFSVHGNMVDAVSQAWKDIWDIDLDRSYTGDFEEYLNDDWENADIDIYIALK